MDNSGMKLSDVLEYLFIEFLDTFLDTFWRGKYLADTKMHPVLVIFFNVVVCLG